MNIMEFSIVLSRLLTCWLLFRGPGDRMASVAVKSFYIQHEGGEIRVLPLLFALLLFMVLLSIRRKKGIKGAESGGIIEIFFGPELCSGDQRLNHLNSSVPLWTVFFIYFLFISHSHMGSISYFIVFLYDVLWDADTRTNTVVIKSVLIPFVFLCVRVCVSFVSDFLTSSSTSP